MAEHNLTTLISLTSILFAILLHELTHVATAFALGCKIHSFKFWPYPAARILKPHHRGKNAAIALSAPFVNVALFVVFGTQFWGLFAAGQLIVATVALLPYPHSDTWQAFTYVK